MKTYHLKDLLKKEILIVEIATGLSQIRKNTLSVLKHDGYTLLGSPDEIKEEDAMELVEETEMGVKLNSKKYKYRAYDSQLGYATATESLLSALEKEILWENPHGKEEPNKSYFLDDKGSFLRKEKKQWHKAQEKTFDRNRSIILVKN